MRSSLRRRVLIATFPAVMLFAMHVEAASKPRPVLTVSVRGPLVILNQEQLYCESSYALSECREQIQKLKQALQPYPTALLPNWKWVLVRAEHWKSLMASLNLHTDSPAITILDDNTTLIEESLIAPRAERAAELINSYKIALDELLDVAVSHELGHAICHEQNEFRAESIGRDLRREIAAGEPVTVRCLQPVVPNAHRGR